MRVQGKSLELFFIDGDPTGLLTAEVFNWTGHILMAPRTRIREALARTEASYTGVYLLVGYDEGRTKLYIGEAEDIARRIGQHDVGKDWWEHAVIVVSAANNLHKAHVKYLEARLVETAHEAGRAILDNKNTPPRSTLSEAARANMESFLENLFIVLPALRIDAFLKRTREAKVVQAERLPADPEFEIIGEKQNVNSTAVLSDGEFVVLEGSRVRREWVGVNHPTYSALYDELRDTGVIQNRENATVVTKNYAFSSPSAAAAIILGRAANGTTEWKVKGSRQTYKEWEAAQLKEVAE